MATLGKNQVFEIKNGDGTSFHNLVLRKSAVESIVMSLGDKISGDVYYKDNSLSVTMHEYITYNGVNYMLVNPPTIVREGIVSDNSELKGMTKYSFVFYHPMCLLSNFPFTDVAVTSDETRYLSESKTFSWIGKPADFVAKMNKNLDGTEWIVEISSRFPQDKLNELSDVIPFDNATIADACKTFYDTWGVPYVVDKVASTEASYAAGKRFKLVMGLPSNEIYANATAQQQNTPFVFQMGHGVGLKNNSRTPRNNKIITRISGYGSENNIPYGYPQVRWYGTAGQAFTYGDHAGVYNDVTIEGVHFDKIISYPIYKGILDGEYVELIKHPFTRTHLMPSVYRTTLFNKISFYDAAGEANTDYDPDITLVDYYDAVYSAQYPYPNTINLQAPSYESHEFEDEKPELGEAHIISATPLNNDLTPASSWDDSLDDEGNYKQSYFQMVLPQLSFDLYACASITEEMQINMRSGACLGCTFTVQVDWDDYKRNFYDEDGNFAPNGSQRDLTKYPKSDQGSIALVLQKDNSTFGTLMPNMYQYPKGETSSGAGDGDTFVILGISLPESYIFAAEWRLDADMKSYMLENNVHYFDYPLKFDEDFLFHNENILSQIRPNTIVRFNYAGQTQALFVKQITVKYGDQPLPQYDITLTDNVEVVLNQIGQVAEDVEKLSTLIAILRQSYGKSVWNELAKKLSKTQDDTAAGYITMLKGLQVGANFVPDILGEGGVLRMREDGKVELVTDILYARMKAYFDTVEVREYQHTGGNRIASIAGNRICRVEWYNSSNQVLEQTQANLSSVAYFRCYFRASDGEDTVRNNWVVGDLAYCHITSIANSSDNPEAKGANQKHLWRLVIGRNADNVLTEDGEGYIDLSNRSTETISSVSYAGYQSGSDAPSAQDDIIQLGNVNDTTRQGAIVEFVTGTDAPSYQIFQNINSFSLSGKNQITIGYNTATGKADMKVYGDAYIGARDRSTFIEYKQDDGTQQHRPTLNIKAHVEFTNSDAELDTLVQSHQKTYDNAIAALIQETEDLQAQIDGAIESYFMTGAPSLTTPPVMNSGGSTYAEPWLDGTETQEERIAILNKHIGDLYYDKATGHGYRFMYDSDNSAYVWTILTDEDVTEALALAAQAQATADGKSTTFLNNTSDQDETKRYPKNYKKGDTWILQVDATINGVAYKAGDILTTSADSATYNAAHWSKQVRYTDDSTVDNFISNTYSPFAQNIQTQVDKKAETWRQATNPATSWTTDAEKAKHVGDLWMDTANGKKTYIYQNTAAVGETPVYDWVAQDVPDDVFTKIDGKSTIFGNAIATPPTNYKKDDMWLLPADATINGVSYKAGEVLSASQDSETYSATHWSKKVRYTDDSAFNGYIDEMLNGSQTSGSSSIIAAATQRAIMSALGGSTIIAGGLMLTSMIALRQNTGTAENPQYTTWAGISGVYDAQARGTGIAAWYGGAKADMEDMTDAQQTAWDALTPEQKAASSDWAKSLDRFDGSGYRASKNIRWTADGKVYIANIHTASGAAIDDYFFEAFAIGIEGTTRYINPAFSFSDIDIVRRSGAAYTITGTSVLNRDENDARYMVTDRFKALFRVYNGNSDITDSFFTNGLPQDTSNVSIKAMFDFWSQGGITALGQGSQGGGGGAGVLYELNDVVPNQAGNQVSGIVISDGQVVSGDGYVLTFSGSQGKWIASPTAETYVLPQATTSALGGIIVSNALGSQVTLTSGAGTTANRYYGVQIDSVGQAFVNIPWTDTVYTLPVASSAALGGIMIGYNGTTPKTYAVQLDANNKAYVAVNWDDAPTDYWHTGDSRTANTVLAAPNGSNGAATFRALVAADIPNLGAGKITSGTFDAARIPDLSGTYAAVSRVSTLEGYFNSGAARKADKLTTACSLWGNNFDGSADITSSIIISTPKTGESDKYIKIGDIYIGYDATNDAIEVYKLNSSNNHVAADFYARGGVSALGAGSSGGGGGGQGDVTWALLADNTDTRQIAPSHLSLALFDYATQTWVQQQGYVTSSGVTSVATGTGLTGGTITSSGTISINSTYQTYISHGESAYNSLSSYLPKSGGTMTGIITRDAGGSWIYGRDNAIIKTTRTSGQGSDWHPAVAVKTSAGCWTFGSVGGEHLGFSYDTDADYNVGNNNSTVISLPAAGSSGTLALTSQIPTNNNQLTNGAGYITSAGSCTYATNANYATSAESATNNVEKLAWWAESDSHNVDNLVSGVTFAYPVHNAPTAGVIASLTGTHNSYQLQIQGQYNGENLYFRNKNGGNQTWNTWRYVIHSGNIGSQSVAYANSAGSVAWGNVTGKPNVCTTDTAQTISGQKTFNTFSNTVPVWITRHGYANEGMSIGVDDSTVTFKHCQDETDASFRFIGEWTDSGSGGGVAAGSKYIQFNLHSGDASISINGNYVIHSGNIGSQSVNYAASAGNADTVDNEHASAFAHRGTANNLLTAGNEFNFISAGFSGEVWFNYQDENRQSAANVNKYYFGDGRNSALAYISSGYFSGRAAGVTINYNNDSNSTYQMLWGSGDLVYGTSGIYCNPYTDYLYASSFYCGNWFRSSGNTGWYSETYGGGWYMSDSSWIRSYGGHGVVAGGFRHSSYDSNDYALTSDGGAFGFIKNKGVWLDLTGYSENYWHPVTAIIRGKGFRKIRVNVQLDSGTAPSWSTHENGFTVCLEVWAVSSGWGTTGSWTIMPQFNYAFANAMPAGFEQEHKTSTAILKLRGGGKYYVETDWDANWVIHNQTWTSEYGDTFGPYTSEPQPYSNNTIYATVNKAVNDSDGYAINSTYLKKSGGTLNGTLIVSAGSDSGWREGIRILDANNGWTTLLLGGSSTSGTSAATWSLHTYQNNFYLANNGYDSFTNGIACVSGNWRILGGNVGIGTSSPSYKLHVSGDIYATGGVTCASDARMKDVISPTDLRVEQVADAPSVRFLWKRDHSLGMQVGTIAQYWQKVLPEAVSDKSGELSLQYGVTALVAAITTAKKVVDHEARIKALEKECADWKQAYSFLERAYNELKQKIA